MIQWRDDCIKMLTIKNMIRFFYAGRSLIFMQFFYRSIGQFPWGSLSNNRLCTIVKLIKLKIESKLKLDILKFSKSHWNWFYETINQKSHGKYLLPQIDRQSSCKEFSFIDPPVTSHQPWAHKRERSTEINRKFMETFEHSPVNNMTDRLTIAIGQDDIHRV